MTYTNPQTVAAIANLNTRADAALAVYQDGPEEERSAALAEYRRLVDEMIEIQSEAIDAGEYKSDL